MPCSCAASTAVGAVRDAMLALFDLLESEAGLGVRAVLGHWLFGYVHPYPGGNGRMARFALNAMLASGGCPWHEGFEPGRPMKEQLSTNFGAAAEDYAAFRAGFPESFFDRLAAFGIGNPEQLLVDLGTGTGVLARGFASRGATVVAIDPDARMLEQARRLDSAAGVSVDYRLGMAEDMPVPDAFADVVTAGQCWHWFDGRRAAVECARVLKPTGAVVIAHFDWLPLPGNVVEATEHLIVEHNPDWRFGDGNGFHPEGLANLDAAAFINCETFSYEIDVPYTPDGWRGRIRASTGVGASLTAEGVHAFDADLQRMLESSFPFRILQVPHRVYAIVGRRAAA